MQIFNFASHIGLVQISIDKLHDYLNDPAVICIFQLNRFNMEIGNIHDKVHRNNMHNIYFDSLILAYLLDQIY